jgi:16S rRNA (guanine966-N2)-methyltransferase
MLRIYGNRSLKTLPGQATRPTSARVREAVFNIWQGSVQNCRWLDLCAGCGAMGAEALCRGASQVVGIEQSVMACRVIRENWQRVATPEQRHSVIKGDVVRQLTRLRNQQFDHIYFDPPYADGLYEPVLAAIASLQLLTPDGELAVEYTPDEWTPIDIEGLDQIREKRYGKTHLAFYAPAVNAPA